MSRELAQEPERAIRFDSYCFHPRQGLTRDGQRISVTPRSLGVLSALLGRAGEIVTKDELFRGVWRNADVSDAALTSCIQELRRALGDNARSPRYIETHHRRGFRFLAQLAPDATSGRLPRELSDALDAISARASVVLCIEDLQWSGDPSALDERTACRGILIVMRACLIRDY